MRKRLLSGVIIAIVLIVCLGSTLAFGASTTDSTDTSESTSATDIPESADIDSAGNVFYGGDTSAPSNQVYDNDYLWAGNSLKITSSTVRGDAFMAGQSLLTDDLKTDGSIFAAGQAIAVEDSDIAGSIRAAGQNIDIAGTSIGHNVTAASEEFSFDADSVARGVFASASTIYFAGTCDYLSLSGETVNVGGKVDGDADIIGDSVTIADDAVITGTLHVTAKSEPAIPAGAKIGNYEFTQATDSSTGDGLMGSLMSGFNLGHALLALAGFLILALLFYWLARPNLAQAAEMFKQRPAPMLLSGFIAVVVAPLVIVILCIMIITIRVAVVLLCVCLAIGMLMSPFTGASLGQLIFKGMPPLPAALIGAGIMAILVIIPVVGALVSLFAALYAVGYCVQWVWMNRIRKAAQLELVPPSVMTSSPHRIMR